MRDPVRLALGLTAALLAAAPAACDRTHAQDAIRVRGRAMGTTWSVVVAHPKASLSHARLRSLVSQVLDRVDARMSTWRDDSELMRFNRSDTRDWFGVSPETALVAREALRIGVLSDGAFDPTVGPLVDLWGFGRAPVGVLPPAAEALARARARVGFRHLHVRDAPPALRKDRPDVELDLSAVAKGYAVDAVAERLADLALEHFLVEVGGELSARGRNAEGDAWRVGIERPALERGRVEALVRLDDESVATSGPYRNFEVRGDRRYGHVLDPRTGEPVRSDLMSVSVIAARAMHADALATALLVLGPEAGFALAQREGLAVLFLERAGDGWRERSTPEFDARRIAAGRRPAG